jgi:hypothetical protein
MGALRKAGLLPGEDRTRKRLKNDPFRVRFVHKWAA